VQFARRFYLAQWYHECSSALEKSSAETSSLISEASSSDAPRRTKKKNKTKTKNRRQSEEDGGNAEATLSAGDGCSNDAQSELKQTQQWLFTQMQAGLTPAAAARFVFNTHDNEAREGLLLSLNRLVG